MNINIQVDFGQGYVVSLTPQDARMLYNQLTAIFNGINTINHDWQERACQSLEDSKIAYSQKTHNPDCLEDWPGCDCKKQKDAEALKAEESPETLREKETHDPDCGCNDCFARIVRENFAAEKGADEYPEVHS